MKDSTKYCTNQQSNHQQQWSLGWVCCMNCCPQDGQAWGEKCVRCHCRVGTDTVAVSQDCKPHLWAAAAGWQGFVPLVLHTHNLWPLKAILSEPSDSSRGTLEKQKGSSTAAHNGFQVRGFLIESQVLMPWLCGTRWSCVGLSDSHCMDVRRVPVLKQTKIGCTYL